MTTIPLQFRAAAATRPAPHHLENEDAWQIYTDPQERGGGPYIVCDGVSTAGDGRAAAQLACARLGEFHDAASRPHPDTLVQLVSEIDWELRGRGNGAKCTLALAWVDGNDAHIFTVGDSPVYRLRGGRVKQAGTEHTGMFRRLRAYLGMGPAVSEVLTRDRWQLLPGDVLMLMSDGVVDALDEDELADLWARTQAPDRCARAILEEVARIGVDDDATIIVVEAVEKRATVSPTSPLEAPDPPRRLTIPPVD